MFVGASAKQKIRAKTPNSLVDDATELQEETIDRTNEEPSVDSIN